MRIYTKSGDKGETSLIGGVRVSKTDARICAIGEVDELNAMIGVLQTIKQTTLFTEVQNSLFAIGARLAGGKTHPSLNVELLERAIDEIDAKLPPLKNFILPGGTPFAAHAHLARAACRRAERAVIALQKKFAVDAGIIIYLNRLSDLLFMAARLDMAHKKKREVIWKATR